jgi:metal-dependent amidase/aminoacylase/carboxypeptidase family protein
VDVRWAGVDYLDLNTNWPLAARFQSNAEQLGRSFFPIEKLPAGSSGSTDMGNVSYRVPSIHPMLAAAPRNVVIHHPDFATWAGSEMGDAAALDGAKSLAMTAVDFLNDSAFQKECQRAFAVSVGLS